jgi:hypothetical protein
MAGNGNTAILVETPRLGMAETNSRGPSTHPRVVPRSDFAQDWAGFKVATLSRSIRLLGAPSFASFHIAYRNSTDYGRKGWVTKLQPSPIYPMGFTVDQRPALDRTQVAGLPVGVSGVQDEPGINDEVKRGFVLKADVN